MMDALFFFQKKKMEKEVLTLNAYREWRASFLFVGSLLTFPVPKGQKLGTQFPLLLLLFFKISIMG